MDERILNANSAEWASIMAEARQLASENWEVDGAAAHLQLREDRLASHINRLARYHGEAEPNEIPNPEGVLRWPGLAPMASAHEDDVPLDDETHQEMMEWIAPNPPRTSPWQRARASADEALAVLNLAGEQLALAWTAPESQSCRTVHRTCMVSRTRSSKIYGNVRGHERY